MLKIILAIVTLSSLTCHSVFAFGGQTSNNMTLGYDAYGFDRAYQDVENNTVYLRARNYDPKVARFISQDSYGLFNRYRGFNNNPITAVDPNGHKASVKTWLHHHASLITQISVNTVSLVVGEVSAGALGYKGLSLLGGIFSGAGGALVGSMSAEVTQAGIWHPHKIKSRWINNIYKNIGNIVAQTIAGGIFGGLSHYLTLRGRYYSDSLDEDFIRKTGTKVGRGGYGTSYRYKSWLTGDNVYKIYHSDDSPWMVFAEGETQADRNARTINRLVVNQEAGFSAEVVGKSKSILKMPFVEVNMLDNALEGLLENIIQYNPDHVMLDFGPGNVGKFNGNDVVFDTDLALKLRGNSIYSNAIITNYNEGQNSGDCDCAENLWRSIKKLYGI